MGLTKFVLSQCQFLGETICVNGNEVKNNYLYILRQINYQQKKSESLYHCLFEIFQLQQNQKHIVFNLEVLTYSF